MIEAQIAEIALTKEAINDLANVQEGSEIISPISSGIFLKSSLLDSKKLLVNVGSGTVVEKTIPETTKIIEEQEAEIKKTYDVLVAELNKLGAKAIQLEESLS